MAGVNSNVLITATVRHADGHAVSDGELVWSPADAVLRLSERTGLFSRSVAGTYVVTATIGNLSHTVIIIVDKDWREGPVDLSLPMPTATASPTAKP